VKSLNLNI